MSFDKVTYLVAVCDTCGPGWWEDISDRPPLFATKAEARKELADTFEWRMERQLDGTFHMLCPTCAGRADCVKYGHQWITSDDNSPKHLQGMPPTCHRCSQVRNDQEPPAGHPDSMTADLGDDEFTLMEIDAAEWPEDTDLEGVPSALARLKGRKGHKP